MADSVGPGHLLIHASRHCNNKEVPSQEFSRVNYYNSSCRGVGTCPHLSKKQKFTPYLILSTVQDGKLSSSLHILAFFPKLFLKCQWVNQLGNINTTCLLQSQKLLTFQLKMLRRLHWVKLALTEFKGLTHSSPQLRGVLRSLLMHFRPQMV